MNLNAVAAQLNDLPATFRPAGNPYAQFIASLASAESLFTEGADATMAQALSFQNAIGGWIDVWGLLFGVPRNQNEGSIPYALRITETVLAWVGTLPAIQMWLDLFAPGGTVVENASGLGYVINLPGGMSLTQINTFLVSLGRIRPAGVPFTVKAPSAGLYLDAEAFLGDSVTFGSYLTTGVQPVALGLNATTPSAQPLVPDLFLVDPGLAQPGLLAFGPQSGLPELP